MSAALAYPRSLQVYFSALSVSRNRFRIRPSSATFCEPNDIIDIDVPNSLVDLDAVSTGWNLTTGTFDTANPDNHYCVAPAVEYLVNNIACENNGQVIDAGPGRMLNHIYGVYLDYTTSDVKKDIRGVVNNDRKYYVAPKGGDYENKTPMRLTNFLGFLGTVQPRIQDFKLYNCRIRIHLADMNAFITDSVTQNWAKFEEIYFYCDNLVLNDGGIYHNGLQKKIAAEGELRMPFNRWYISTQGPEDVENVQSFTVSTGSLDGFFGWFMDPASADSTNTGRVMTGQWGKYGDFTYGNSTLAITNPKTQCVDAAGAVVAGVFTPPLATAFPLWTDVKPKQFVRGPGSDATLKEMQWSLQNVSYPNWPINTVDAFVQTTEAFGVLDDASTACAKWLNCMDSYEKQGFVHYVPLTFPHAESELRLRSGINTIGNLGSLQYRTVGITGANKPRKVIAVKTTPILRLGAYKQTEVDW